MLARNFVILFSTLFLLSAASALGQSAYINTQQGIYRLTGSPGNCDRVLVHNECGIDNNILSIAVYKDTVYYNTWLGELKRFTIGVAGSNEVLLNDGAVYNAMTVDKNGIIYMASSELVRFDPHTKQLTHLGGIPFNSMGDLSFYKDKLLMAGYDPFDWSTGIYEIDINDPGNSELFMSTPSFFGLLSYPVSCGNSRYFGLLANNAGSTSLVELDLANKTGIGETCSMPLDILDAASVTENGMDSKVAITGLIINKSCQSSTGSVQVNATYPAAGTITYTLDNTITNTTGSFNTVAVGQHRIKVIAPGGMCYTDSLFTIEASYNLITSVTKTNPDYCANIRGSINIKASDANGAITYTLLNTGANQPTGNFNNLRGGLYNFRVTNTSGCSKDTSIALVENIPIGGCNDIFIPNAFTPNSDGRNDLFTITLSSAFKNVQLQIFDRWGNVVCHAKGNTVSWDGNFKGTQQPVGIYVYTLLLTGPNGVQKNLKGTLSLLR